MKTASLFVSNYRLPTGLCRRMTRRPVLDFLTPASKALRNWALSKCQLSWNNCFDSVITIIIRGSNIQRLRIARNVGFIQRKHKIIPHDYEWVVTWSDVERSLFRQPKLGHDVSRMFDVNGSRSSAFICLCRYRDETLFHLTDKIRLPDNIHIVYFNFVRTRLRLFRETRSTQLVARKSAASQIVSRCAASGKPQSRSCMTCIFRRTSIPAIRIYVCRQ